MSDLAAQRAKAVRLMIFDVDGVMTDGRLYFSARGEEMKAFNILDGHGLKMLQGSGIAVAILTARRSAIVEHRARELGISSVRQGVSSKLAGFQELLVEHRLTAPDAGYAGDDLMDLPVLARCGFSASVPNASMAVQRRVHLVTRARGGEGAVRELCEFILDAQGSLDAALTPYLE
ncbi:MAG: phenylphosphate carboxylase subunit delta [Betaproteobacteria bacterium]|nr:phenylphosphate carboxylase subunit delta [Betaproteobacteria bacterium]